MKRFGIAAATIAALTVAAEAQTLRIGVEGNHPPFNQVGADGTVAGFDVDVGNAICARAQLTCEWVQVEWEELIPSLLAGDIDIIMSTMAITDARLELIDFAGPYYPPASSNYAARAGSTYDFAAMSGLRIGVQAGTIQADYANANLAATNTILEYPSIDNPLADLAAGTLDLVLADRGYLAAQVAATAGVLVLAGPDVMIGNGVGAGFRKEDSELHATFDAIIAEMRTEGTLNALIMEWIPDPTTF
ncbi:MAG: transporter substrate-binding domain-containing protein [Bauldia sp.]